MYKKSNISFSFNWAVVKKSAKLAIPKKEAFRDFVAYTDLEVFIFDWVMNSIRFHGPLNFATGKSLSITDWVRLVAIITNTKVRVLKDKMEPMQYSIIDSTKLENTWSHTFIEPSEGLSVYVNGLTLK